MKTAFWTSAVGESSYCYNAVTCRNALVERLQPGADLACCDIGLVEELAHGEEAVELAGK